MKLHDASFHLVIAEELGNLPTINSNALSDLQGNLKDLSEKGFNKLSDSLRTHGFIVPLFVWFHDHRAYTLDGNQRLRVIRTIFPNGVFLPYVKIAASDANDAKRKILLISSQYGKTTKEGFDEFIGDMPGAEVFVREMTTFGEFLDRMPEEEQQQAKQVICYDLKVILESDDEREKLYDKLLLDGYNLQRL